MRAQNLKHQRPYGTCNMAVEAGAKTGIFEADDKALEYLKEHGREPKAVYHSDPDAVYAREYTFDLSKVRPVVAKPDLLTMWFRLRKPAASRSTKRSLAPAITAVLKTSV